MKFIEIAFPDQIPTILRVAAIDSISLQEKMPTDSKLKPRLLIHLTSQKDPLIFQGVEAKAYYNKIKKELVSPL